MKAIACAVALCILGGCATAPRGATYVPLVDMKGKTEALFSADLKDCQGYADQRLSAERSAAAGAVVGALLGALIAPRGYKTSTAAVGAGAGAAGGAGNAQQRQEFIVKMCMSGRGYMVLD